MWDKFFYGASKLFANDASKIVSSEMKKKQSTKKQMDFDDEDTRERAKYINQLRTILLAQKNDIGQLLDIPIEFLDILEATELDDERTSETIEKLCVVLERVTERYVELNELITIGEHLATVKEEYTIKYKTIDLRKQNYILEMLANEVKEISRYFDDEQMLSVLLENCASVTDGLNALDENLDELFEELTQFNIIRICSDGQSHTIDYND